MDNQEQLKKLGRIFNSDKLVTNEDLTAVLKGVLSIMNSFKKDNEKLTSDTREVVDSLLNKVLEEKDKILSDVSSETKKTKDEVLSKLEKSVSDMQKMCEEMMMTKPEDGMDGKDADEEKIIQEVLSKIELPKYKEVILDDRQKIVEKINSGKKKDIKIEAQQITGLPEFTREVVREIGTSFTETPIKAGSNITVSKDTSGAWVINSTASVTGGGHVIQDATTTFTQRTNLKFLGAGVAVTDDSGNDATVVTISASGGASTLADVSSFSTDATKSLYTMTSTVPVEFKTSGGTTALKIKETNAAVSIGTATPYSYAGTDVGLTVQGSGTYGVLALKAAQPLIKWVGTYNSGNGAELYQDTSGNFNLNPNASTIGFVISSTGNLYLNNNKYIRWDTASSSAPSMWGSTSAWGLDVSSVSKFWYYNDKFGLASTTALAFGTFSTEDTGLARLSAGVVKVTDGSTGYGKLNLAGGTTSAPGVSFDTYTNTGFGRSDSDGIFVTYGGTKILGMNGSTLYSTINIDTRVANQAITASPSAYGENLLLYTTTATQTANDGGSIGLGSAFTGLGGAKISFARLKGIAENNSGNGGALIFANSNRVDGSMQEFMRLDGAGNLGIGTTSPTNILSLGGNSARTIWMERHTTANTAGNNLTIQSGGATSGATDKDGGILYGVPGLTTGTGKNSIRLQRLSRAASTGTTDNTLSDAFIIPSEFNLTNSSANSLFEIALPTLTMTGGTIDFIIECSDGTDMQVYSGIVKYSAVNKGGSYTVNKTEFVTSQSFSNGTLTTTWDVTSGTNKVTLQVTPVSSLTPTSYKIKYTLLNVSGTVTQL